jgi:hypothetical protein
MSGLLCPHCGKIIDVFKKHGGVITAQKEQLKLLTTLPIEPEVVKKGDSGDMSLLDDDRMPITQMVNKMVDQIIAMSSMEKDLDAREPMPMLPDNY